MKGNWVGTSRDLRTPGTLRGPALPEGRKVGQEPADTRGVCMITGKTGDLMEDLRREKGRILLREHLGMFLKVFVAGFMLAAIFAVPFVIWMLGAEVRTLKDQVATA